MRTSAHNRGFALLLAMIVSSVVLAIGLSILSVSVNQLNLSSTARESEFAFQTAHAGLGCIVYWSNEQWDTFVKSSITSGEAATLGSLSCFDEVPVSFSNTNSAYQSGGNYTNIYSYTYEWGDSEERCTQMDLYILNAADSEYTPNISFPNDGVGTNGVKTCPEGNMCTVAISRGYNLACAELDTSIFAVQRELTIEY